METDASSDHRQQAFENIQKFINENSNMHISKQKLYKILRYYEKWIRNGGGGEFPNDIIYSYFLYEEGFYTERVILSYMLISAFCSNMDDSKYIGKLLIYLEKRIYVHFTGILNRIEVFWEVLNPDAQIRFVEFVFTHANRRRLMIRGMRIPDLCIYRGFHPSADFISNSPEIFLLFLRFGAFTTRANDESQIHIFETLLWIIDLGEFYRSWTTNDVQGINIHTHVIRCGRMILRVCPQLSKSHASRKYSRHLSPNINIAMTFWKWVADNGLPELKFRLFEPASLQHVCRLKVREILHEKWLLPKGIEQLPLPTLLKRYLDLFYD